MLRYLLSFFLLGLSLSSVSQYTITGRVVDSASQKPLFRASVFCQGTTLGTSTDKDGYFQLTLRTGGYDLTISYIGYAPSVIRVNESTKLTVELVKKDNSLTEVILKSSNEVADGWEKYGDFFRAQFIGESNLARSCVIRNPEVLRFLFYKKSNRLKVLADEPLLVVNPALGYEIRYQLDSFVYYYNTQYFLYRGYSFYTELSGDDSSRSQWARNRQFAYRGSRLQFMHNYYDSTLQENGWVVDLLEQNSEIKFAKIDPYDTTYYVMPDSTGEMEIWFPRKVSITYLKRSPELEYLKTMKLPKGTPYLISYIDLKDPILVRANGYFYNQSNWIQQGYWVWKNLGDQLPNDYEPD
ncbi:MAG: carboxypeptidase-like regulatory domain-containing protein [Bacteroidota bacterium]